MSLGAHMHAFPRSVPPEHMFHNMSITHLTLSETAKLISKLLCQFVAPQAGYVSSRCFTSLSTLSNAVLLILVKE